MNILIGCDPEIFVSRNGQMASAYGLIPGTKKEPFKVNNGAVQVDGMALEFNINPASDEETFLFSVTDVMNQLALMVPDYKLAIQPVAHFTEQLMKEQPAEALELGCDPDFNAWTMNANIKPDQNRPMRTASGHVHIGWTEGQNIEALEAKYNAATVAKQMDFFLGLGSLFYDNDQERREMYGKAGCMRVKPYGMEYRTLSNAWLLSEDRIRWVYRQARLGMEALFAGNILAERWGDIQGIINSGDKNQAHKIMVTEDMEIPE